MRSKGEVDRRAADNGRIAAPPEGQKRLAAGRRRWQHAAVSRRRVIVQGRVQAVGFRQATWEVAREAGVGGWVRNRRDGTVEAVLEGPPEAVERVLRFLRRGPLGARVDRVEVTDEPPEGLHGFAIR